MSIITPKRKLLRMSVQDRWEERFSRERVSVQQECRTVGLISHTTRWSKPCFLPHSGADIKHHALVKALFFAAQWGSCQSFVSCRTVGLIAYTTRWSKLRFLPHTGADTQMSSSASSPSSSGRRENLFPCAKLMPLLS
uniref:Uncharacterized protein n=1 Tax=Cacopsylla melanoneura TaxID=428564 RepID=A0A8D8XSE1_9HEMI